MYDKETGTYWSHILGEAKQFADKDRRSVAEEDGCLDGPCQALLSDIIAEVNRLTMFLRSFSRLARLQKPQMEEVCPAQTLTSRR